MIGAEFDSFLEVVEFALRCAFISFLNDEVFRAYVGWG